ncbi:MAG: DUF2530 domain-containing protein [Mycolicibacterium sp.]|jgi:hypothetical protein|nr:DUF2530 domain-containing protein [Mycolicibacterium sp.]
MSDDPTDPPAAEPDDARPAVAPPPLPAVLLDPRPVIAVCTLAWVVAAVAAFTLPSLQTWRPVTVAGLGLAVFGTLLFLWQRHAARSGWRGAQTGLQ